jgi:hypothetical protein
LISSELLEKRIAAILERDPLIESRISGSASTADVSDLLNVPDGVDFVRNVYSRLFARDPENAEVAEHLRQLSTCSRPYVLDSIIAGALALNPHLTVQGRWARRAAGELARLSGPDLVTEAFRVILWRNPTDEEYVRYLCAADRLGSKAFLAELASVPEAQQYPRIEDLFVELSGLQPVEPNGTFVVRAYQTILARDPDPEGFRGAIAALRWMSKKRVAKTIANSPEADRRTAVFLWQGRPFVSRSVRASIRLHIAGLVDSLLAGLYHRVAAIERQLAGKDHR